MRKEKLEREREGGKAERGDVEIFSNEAKDVGYVGRGKGGIKEESMKKVRNFDKRGKG